jgi:hypothetical protein
VGFGWNVLFIWVLGGGYVDGLICGGEALMWWVGSRMLMEWPWSLGFGYLQNGGDVVSFVRCFLMVTRVRLIGHVDVLQCHLFAP